MKQELDFSIQGEYQRVDKPTVTLRLFGQDGLYDPPDIVSTADEGQGLAAIEALRNELAFDLLRRFGVPLDDQLMATIRRTPTANLDALQLNADGVKLVTQGQPADAQAKFQAALALDPNYSAANANLGWVLSTRGDYTAALSAYQAAVQQLPGYAPYHYNLGNL
jgi:tetratricopeptide (TPR) repeat protein